MKMYSEYTNNYKGAIQIFEDCLKKKKKFADIVRLYEVKKFCLRFNELCCMIVLFYRKCLNVKIFPSFLI